MNKPIRTMAVFCLLLFLALLVNVTYLQYVAAEELGEDPNNRRVIAAAFSRERGPILVGRDPVAESVASDDQYDYQRTYPQPFKYAHLTGFFSYYNATGIELSQNGVLSGDDSRFFVTRMVDLISNDSPRGGSVQLTIDPAAQDAAWTGLEGLGPEAEAAVVALEPATGRILAMASVPSYDPNRLASHDFGAVLKAYDELDSAESEPLLNRAIQTTLPPGSTFKLVTAAAAIESGRYDADSMVLGGSGYRLPQSSSVVRNYPDADCGTGEISLTQALSVSCNVSFLDLADKLGAEAMREQAEKFGFNTTYLDDLPLQATSNYPADLDRPQTALSGIGQGSVTASPLQMAMVVAGIANTGQVPTPYLVDEIRSPDRDLLDQADPTTFSEAVSPATAAELTRMMVTTVQSGTASPGAIPGIPVAGKTGTAEAGGDRPPYAWFVSFAPADNPQVAVAVMVESSAAATGEISGGQLGGPIASAVMRAVIEQ